MWQWKQDERKNATKSNSVKDRSIPNPARPLVEQDTKEIHSYGVIGAVDCID